MDFSFGPAPRPNRMGQPLNKRGKEKWSLHSPQQQKFLTSKIKSHLANRCGCDFVISSSNSHVESPVIRCQMTLTRLTVFPRRSSTMLSSNAMGGTSTARSSLIRISSASNTWEGSKTYFLNCDTWNTVWSNMHVINKSSSDWIVLSNWPLVWGW